MLLFVGKFKRFRIEISRSRNFARRAVDRIPFFFQDHLYLAEFFLILFYHPLRLVTQSKCLDYAG